MEKIDNNQIRKFQNIILKWYYCHGRSFPWRRRRLSLYQRIVSEVLLQRTRAETVCAYYKTFFDAFPDWHAIVTAPEVRLQGILRPLGLWQRRAQALKSLAMAMIKTGGRYPVKAEEVEDLPGIGQYIANAVQLFCHHKCKPLLDVNMARVLERYFGPRQLADIRYDPYLQQLAHRVVDSQRAAEINWAILDHAALVCTINLPKCSRCPLNRDCRYARKVAQNGVNN